MNEGTDPGSTAATSAAVASDRLYFGYLATGGDVDLYSFSPRTPDTQVGVRLSHLAGDGDLVLFGPPQDSPTTGPSPVTSRPVGPQVGPIDDEGIDPTNNQVASRPEISADVPVAGPSGTTVVARSATDGSVDEETATGRGASYVQVSSYKGANSNLPYVLRVREVSAPALPQCLPYTHPYSGVAGTLPDLTTIPTDLRTVFLVNLQRLGDQFPGQDVSALLAKLNTLAADSSVKGVVLPVEGSSPARNAGYPDIAGAYSALAAKACDPDLAVEIGARFDHVLVDGNWDFVGTGNVTRIVKGDACSLSIACPVRHSSLSTRRGSRCCRRLPGRTGIDLGVAGVPETFVIDSQGVVREHYAGPLTEDVLTRRILPALK